MSDEYRRIEATIHRLSRRRERIVKLKGDLDAIIAEIDTDITALKLQLDALHYEGDSSTRNGR